MTAAEGQPGDCIACGQGDWRPWLGGLRDYLTGDVFDVVRCGQCGLGMTCPAPAEADLARYYPARYRGNRHAGTKSVRSRLRARALERAAGLASGHLLDLGAGDAGFALLMQEKGWQVAATELDVATVEALRERGIDARLSSEAARSPWAEPFDAITCWHVLEHVNDPPALLKQSHALLKPGGVLQVTVPSLSSWQARLGGRNWFHLDLPRHLFHFTPGALTRLLERNGFEIVRRGSFAFEYDWFGSIQTPLNALLPRMNALFEGLTAAPGTRRWSGPFLVSALLAAPIGAVTLLPTLLAGAAGRGATLTFTCRRTS
jgi:SAM-dependent methyltransferase